MTDSLRATLQSALEASYTVERELGGGGMSRVFLATDRALGRQVVIKILSPELAEGVRADRFAREIRLAAGLQHPNIVPLLAAGDAAGMSYYTMPFVEGESLGARLKQGDPMPVPDVVSLLKDVARALAFAHSRGVVHRDIKPDNVLMTGGVASVIDFGIAKALTAAREAGDGLKTTVGVSLGTPEYMAPEQALADQTSDHRVDLYAFGCLAYELLAGKSPFHGRSQQQMVMAHVTETAPPLPETRPDVPAPLAELVARCLEKDPEARPQSADEIVAALSALSTSTHAAVTAGSKRSSGAPGAARARMLTRRFAVGAVGGVLVAALAYAGISGWRDAGGGAADEMSIAVLPFANVGGDTADAYFADGMADELISALVKVPTLRVAARSSSFSFRGKNVSATEVAQALGVGAVLEGSVRRAGGQLRLSAQLISAATGLALWSDTYQQDAKDVFAVQDAVAQAIVAALRTALGVSSAAAGQEPASLRGTANLEAYDLFLKGLYHYQRRGAGTRIGRDFLAQAVEKDPTFARAHAWLAMATLGVPIFQSTQPGEYKQKAIASARRSVALDGSLADGHLALALTTQALFQWPEARAQYEAALAIEPRHATVRHQYGRWFLYNGKIADAVRELELADRLDPFSTITIAFLAHSYSLAGQHSQAVAAARRALGVDSTLVGAQSFAMRVLLEAGREAEARVEALRSASRPHADVHVLAFAAYTLGKTGDMEGAKRLLNEIKTRPGEEHRRSRALVTAYLGVGDTTNALQSLEDGLDSGDARPELNSFSDQPFDVLRSSPRFAAIIKRYGLDVAVFTAPRGGRP